MFPPSRAPLFEWLRTGRLSPARWEEAHRLLGLPPSPAAWYWLFDRLLLGLAIAALGGGLIFFVAFNWHALGRLPRLLLVALPLLPILLLTSHPGRTAPTREGSLLLAALNLGALLALMGQTYQSGADPYELFALWALLLLPLAWLGRSPTLWALCWLLTQVALLRYWQVTHSGLDWLDEQGLAWSLTLGNGLLWALVRALPRTWLPEALPALAAGLGSTLLVLLAITEIASPLAWLLWLGWIACAYLAWHGHFLTGLALGALSFITVLLALVAHQIELDAMGALLLALLAIALSAAAVRWLAREARHE